MMKEIKAVLLSQKLEAVYQGTQMKAVISRTAYQENSRKR